MALKRRKRELAEEDFQMAPMIDMVFLLLVFFMCVSTLAQADKKDVNLPESFESQVPEDLAKRVSITVGPNGACFWGAHPIDLPELKQRISTALSKDSAMRFLVRADREVTFFEIKKVLKACAESGAYDVIYATHQSQ